MANTNFAILGAGAMGTIVGAHLARAGHDVTMLVRERRAKQITAMGGLRVKGLIDFSIPVKTLTDPAKLPGTDVLIITTKALHTAAALEPLKAANIETALSIQNGVMKNELLTAAFPNAHILGALANFSGEALPTGEVLFTRNVNLTLGELNGGLTPRAQSLATTIDNAGVRASAVTDIVTQEWSKFAAWVGMAAVAVLTRVHTWKYLVDPGSALVAARLIREVGELAAACHVELTDESMFPVATLCSTTEKDAVDIIRNIGEGFRRNSPGHRVSTLQDLEAHRPLELDETMGHAVRKAAQLNLQLPLLEAVYNVIAAIDRSSST